VIFCLLISACLISQTPPTSGQPASYTNRTAYRPG